jgi:opacity protein-like surface antigen
LIPVRPTTAVRSLAVVEKALLGIAVVAALFGGRAVAADLEASTPPPPPAPNWSGPYTGVGVAARYNAVDANITSASVGTPPTAIPLPNVSAGYTNPFLWWGSGPGAMQFIDNISIGVRVYGGWNYQVAPAWVVGVEGDFAYANESAVFHGSPYPANLLFGSPSLPFGPRQTTSSRSGRPGMAARACAAVGSPPHPCCSI